VDVTAKQVVVSRWAASPRGVNCSWTWLGPPSSGRGLWCVHVCVRCLVSLVRCFLCKWAGAWPFGQIRKARWRFLAPCFFLFELLS